MDGEDVDEYRKWSESENFMFGFAIERFPEEDENRWKNVATMLPHRSPEELAQHHQTMIRYEKHREQQEQLLMREWLARNEQKNVPENLATTEQQNVNGCADPAVLQQSHDEDLWKIKKVLQEFDLNRRLLVTMSMARKFVVPVLRSSDEDIVKGIVVPIWDVDTKTQHSLLFQKWSRSYVFTGNWTRDFVMRRGLKRKDVVGFYWDPSNNRFNFSLLRKDM